MDPKSLLDLLTGTGGGFVLALLLIYALVWGGQIVPGRTHEETERRATAAEAEAETYATTLREREETVTELKVSNARLEVELAGARKDLTRMEGKQDRNTRMLSDLRDEMGTENGEEK